MPDKYFQKMLEELGTTPEEFKQQALEALKELQQDGQLLNINYENADKNFWN